MIERRRDAHPSANPQQAESERRDRAESEAELRRRAAELSAADRRKDEFLAMLAHELRNPLAPLLNALHIIRRDAGTGSTIESAAAIMERQLGYMVRLVDDLLDVSRISRGRIELRRERIDAVALVAQAVEAARPEALARNIALTLAAPDAPAHLDADPARLSQVVGNLLNNALKFTDPGGHVDVRAEAAEDSLVLQVVDDGIGLDADGLAHMFELFMQVDRSVERSASGLGIGLTLVRSLVELHGGTVEASSPGLGRGAAFVVRLPLAPAPSKVRAPEAAAVAPAAGAARRILVVDDNVDSARTLGLVLELEGNEVRLAFNGEEAVAAAEEFAPAVVLLDIGLPRLSGYEVARAIRSHAWGRSMRLVALTGWSQEADRRRSGEAGFDAHLVKPVEPGALLRLLADEPATAL